MSWPKVRLGDLGKMIRGSGIRRNETVPEGLPCIRYGEIYTTYDVVLDRPRSFVPPSLYENCPHIKKGDLVLALTGENKEEIAKSLAYLGEEEVAAGGDTAVWTGHGCDPLYLAYMMYSPRMIKTKADASNGHIVVHASVKKLRQIEVSLPPLSEQHKIAASVDKAMKRVDAIERQFEKLRETASARFKAERKATFDEVGKSAKMIRLVDACQRIVDCPHTTAKDEGAGFPLVRTPNVGFGRLIYEKMHRVSKPVFDVRNARAVPCVGDLIFAREAPAGNVAVIQDGEHVCLGQRTVLLQPNNSMVRSDYLALAILSPESQRRLKGKAFGATVEHVNVKDLRELEVGVPALKQQLDVERRIYAAKARCDGIAALAARGLANCARMRKAILADAFAV